jgi:hypothetical protein
LTSKNSDKEKDELDIIQLSKINRKNKRKNIRFRNRTSLFTNDQCSTNYFDKIKENQVRNMRKHNLLMRQSQSKNDLSEITISDIDPNQNLGSQNAASSIFKVTENLLNFSENHGKFFI